MAQTPDLETRTEKPFCIDIEKDTGYPRHSALLAKPVEGQTRLCYDSRRSDAKTGVMCPYHVRIGNGDYCSYHPPQSSVLK